MVNTINFIAGPNGYRSSEVSTKKGLDGPVPAVYTVKKGRFHLSMGLTKVSDRFELEVPKYTDDIPKEISELVVTNLDQVPNSNIMITGKAGMGRTLTSKTICNALLDQGIPVYMINSNVPVATLRRYAEATNGKRVVFLFDDLLATYGAWRGIDQFIAFLSDPQMHHVINIMTTSQDIKYSRLDVVEGRPSRTYYRLNFNSIVMAKSPELLNQLTKDLMKLKGGKWRKAILDEYIKEKMAVTNFDTFNLLAGVLLEAKDEASARSAIKFINVTMEKRR